MSSEGLGSNIPAPKKSSAKTPAVGLPPTVRIVLEENDNIPPTGQFFGLNGKGYILKPGVEVNVPRGIIDILDNAVMSSPIIDNQTRQVIGYRNSMRYPYRLVTQKVPAPTAEDDF